MSTPTLTKDDLHDKEYEAFGGPAADATTADLRRILTLHLHVVDVALNALEKRGGLAVDADGVVTIPYDCPHGLVSARHRRHRNPRFAKEPDRFGEVA